MSLRIAITAILLAGASAIVPQHAEAGTTKKTAVAAPVDPVAHKAQCDRLAAAVAPDRLVPVQVDMMLVTLSDSMLENRNFEAMERQYPGLAGAITDRVRPIIVRDVLKMMPDYRAELSTLYCANLSIREARLAGDFFLSPDGVAMVDAVTSNMDFKHSSNAMMDGQSASASAVDADKRAASRKAIKQLSQGQIKRIGAFFQTPTGRKLIAINPQKSKIDQKWFNYAPPGSQEEVKVATLEAMLDHVAKTDPETAEQMRKGLEKDGLLPKKAQ